MKYFTFSEFERSDISKSSGIPNRIPNDEVRGNIIKLVDNVLDVAREHLGFPLVISSGYRSLRLNEKVGSKYTSQHRTGEAADVICKDNKRLFDYIKGNLDFDQLIWENGGKWVHVSYTTRRKNRKQVLIYH